MVRNLFFAALAVALLAGIGYANQSTSRKVVIPISRTPASSGKQMYVSYCAPCHGVDGRGQGPVASALKKQPADLALLSKNNGGKFADVRYYGQWMRDEAEKRIGHLYPKVKITKELVKERPDLKEYVGEELTVIAWLWANGNQSKPCLSRHTRTAHEWILVEQKGGQGNMGRAHHRPKEEIVPI